MKILFHLNSMGRGGAERVVSVLSNNFVQCGHEVVITTQWNSQQEYPVDKRVRRVHVGLELKDDKKGRIAKIWLRYARLRKCIKKERPDIVISFCNKANFRSAFALLGTNIPLLVSVRNDPRIDYAPYRLSTKIMEGVAAGCVFQTPDAMKFFSKGLQEKSRIIFNPLSEEYFRVEECEENHLPKQKEIVTVGRICRQKNQMLLVRAFHKVLQSYPDYILKIYGDVQEKEVYQEIEQYVFENGLQDKILFMGVADSLRDTLSTAAVFVLPSDYEGMPNTLIEAMALGLTCIATDCPCGGSALLIKDKASGVLVPVGDCNALQEALEKVLAEPDKAESMGKNAKKVLEKVNPDRICEEWIEYIEELKQCLLRKQRRDSNG